MLHFVIYASWSAALMLLSAVPSHAAFDLGYHDDSDLTSFVTHPEIKAPLFDVHIYDADALTNGYWFVAPYVELHQRSYPKNQYQTCQIGPHIYDQLGNLVWSGACAVENQNTFDFRAWPADDGFVMTAILGTWSAHGDPSGHGILMDATYDVTTSLGVPEDIRSFNMHEMHLLDNGTTAIQILAQTLVADVTELELPDLQAGRVRDMGFREVDLKTGETLFQWWALEDDNVRLIESNGKPKIPTDEKSHPWDWFHANSVDKNEDGDYLLSSRYTDTIFKVSGQNGSILWRLGGRYSSFTLNNFNFSRQHDARWLSTDRRTGEETITFLDNAADDFDQTSTTSSAVTVILNTASMTAEVTKRIYRPDGKLTRLRGNYQTLPTGNHFVCWAGNSYISEHHSNGDPIMEARFQSERFVTYRAYKRAFKGHPRDQPTVKAMSFGMSKQTCTTVVYVSWNGATEVALWRFVDGSSLEIIGEKNRTGFETAFQRDQCFDSVLAQAIATDGQLLGESSIEEVRPLGDTNTNQQAASESQNESGLGDFQGYIGIQYPVSRRQVELWLGQQSWLELSLYSSILTALVYTVLRRLLVRRVRTDQARRLLHCCLPICRLDKL